MKKINGQSARLRRKSIRLNLNFIFFKKTPLLKCMKEAALRFDQNIKVFGGDSNPEAISQYSVDKFWVMKIKDYSADELVSELKKRNISVVLPTRTEELSFWSHNQKKLKDNGITVIVSEKQTIENCTDKLKFSDLYSKNFDVIPSF